MAYNILNADAFESYYSEPGTCFSREPKEQVSNHSGLEFSYFECIIDANGNHQQYAAGEHP